MHHRKSGRKFGRNSAHRKAMFRNMAVSILKHELIKTTLPKAKEVRGFIEPLITLGATDSVANRRLNSYVYVIKRWLLSYLMKLVLALRIALVGICA